MNLSEMANRITELENLNANLTKQLEQACEERDALQSTIDSICAKLDRKESFQDSIQSKLDSHSQASTEHD
jgi:chromosome segregation ATPase